MRQFLSTISLPQALIIAFSVRFLALGSHLSDAVIIVALASLEGLRQYLASTKKDIPLPVNEQAVTDIAELKSAVQALKVGRAFGR